MLFREVYCEEVNFKLTANIMLSDSLFFAQNVTYITPDSLPSSSSVSLSCISVSDSILHSPVRAVSHQILEAVHCDKLARTPAPSPWPSGPAGATPSQLLSPWLWPNLHWFCTKTVWVHWGRPDKVRYRHFAFHTLLGFNFSHFILDISVIYGLSFGILVQYHAYMTLFIWTTTSSGEGAVG